MLIRVYVNTYQVSVPQAFPPPAPPPSQAGDKKTTGPTKPDPLAAMWRQNARINFYTDSEDSSDTDSGVTPSDSDTSSDSMQGVGRAGAGRGTGRGRNVGNNATGKSSSSSTVSSSSSGCVSNVSCRSTGGSRMDGKGDRSGPLLNRRNNGGVNGTGGSSARSLSNQATSRADENAGRKGVPRLLFRDTVAHKTAWAGREGSRPPPAPASQRKPPLATGRGAHHAQHPAAMHRAPQPGSHAHKPRSHSVTKAVPEKLHTKASENMKSMYPRIKSAQPARLAYHHRLQPAPYDARMLAISAGASDSSSSDNFVDAGDSDDSSDDDSR